MKRTLQMAAALGIAGMFDPGVMDFTAPEFNGPSVKKIEFTEAEVEQIRAAPTKRERERLVREIRARHLAEVN